jgi:hypothetical protein
MRENGREGLACLDEVNVKEMLSSSDESDSSTVGSEQKKASKTAI